ncbi:hypothetical protein ASPBRDRAFT_44537 [Aspergillus brasiliensis CBS 101740]|uniref:Uncharacterized protein n=1 Tax=Aspergillus brasiliensis (strain CBS 101740 / IMI 381727 / IBT 21946) TaxID=767769 RepID=A0A1L9UFE2_ASPBC|nr:hypothetical protein ASPBRDRAFT_44537 [Aspergillus brasiliensis CBS 101740]
MPLQSSLAKIPQRRWSSTISSVGNVGQWHGNIVTRPRSSQSKKTSNGIPRSSKPSLYLLQAYSPAESSENHGHILWQILCKT